MNLNKFLFIILLTILSISYKGYGDTFIGNGANMLDYDLAITLDRINLLFKDYLPSDVNNCECKLESENSEGALCKYINTFISSQREYCAIELKKYVKQIEFMSSKNSILKLNFKNLDDFELQGNVNARKVTAIALRENNTILIHQQSYLRLNKYEKLSLLVHELFHFVKSKDGSYRFDDDLEYGPFDGKRGGSDLLSLFGASSAIAAKTLGVGGISGNDRSYSYKDHWFRISGSTFYLGKKEKEGFLTTSNSRTLTDFEYSYVPESFGVLAVIGSTELKGSQVDGANLSVKSNYYGAGLAYRLFPIPSTFRNSSKTNQLNIVFQTGLKFGIHRFKISDSFTKLEDKSISYSFFGKKFASYPLAQSFWIEGGISLISERIKFNKIDSDIETNNIGTTYGVSYGF